MVDSDKSNVCQDAIIISFQSIIAKRQQAAPLLSKAIVGETLAIKMFDYISMSSNTHFSNVLNENLSLTGSKSYIIDDAHFTEQECNITSDGTLNVCCPIKFKEILCIDGQLGCNQLVVRTGATGGITFSNDSCDGAVTTLPRLFEDAANLNLSAPSLKNLNVNTPAAMNIEAAGGNVNITAHQGTAQSINMTSDKVNIAGLLNLTTGSFINDHPRYFGFGSEGNRGDKRGDIRINVKPATTTNPTMVGSLYVCIEDYENVSPPTDRAIWGRVDLNSW